MHAGQEPGAGDPYRADSDRRARAHARSSNSDGRSTATRSGSRTASASRTARKVSQRFPWTIRINGEDTHSFNANRISLVIPQARRGRALDVHQRRRRLGSSDPSPLRGRHHDEPWQRSDPEHREARAQGRVAAARLADRCTFQVQFGEYGGSYASASDNALHRDFAMGMRIQVLAGAFGSAQATITPTPNPSPDGVTWSESGILPEGDPR